MHLQTKMASQSYFLVVLLITLLPSGIEHCTFQKAVVSSGFSPLIKVNVFSWLENSSRLHCSEEFCVGVVLVLVLFFFFKKFCYVKKPRRTEERLAASPEQDAPM